MSDWLDETREELSAAEADLKQLYGGLLQRPTEGAREEESREEDYRRAWKCYMAIEKAVVFIKVELGEENPGRFVNTKAYLVPDEKEALLSAVNSLSLGLASIEKGELQQALTELRESRNFLRMLLKRQKRAKKKLIQPRAESQS